MSNEKNGIIWIGLIIVLFIALFNVHFKVIEVEKTKTIVIDIIEEVYVGPQIDGIYCDKPIYHCYQNVNCPENNNIITYQRESNVVGNRNSNNWVFYGDGTCTLKYKIKLPGLKWL